MKGRGGSFWEGILLPAVLSHPCHCLSLLPGPAVGDGIKALNFWMQASRQEGFAAVSAIPFHQLRSRRVCWEQHEPGSHLCSSSGLSPVCSESFGGPGSNWPLLPETVGCSWRDGGFLNPWRRRSPVGTAPLLPQVLVLPASDLGTSHPCAGIHGGLLGAQVGKDNGCSPVLIL